MENFSQYVPWVVGLLVVAFIAWLVFRSSSGGVVDIDLGEDKPKAKFTKNSEETGAKVESVTAQKSKKSSVKAEGPNSTVKDVDLSEAEGVNITASTK